MNRTPLRAAASRVFAQAIAALALLGSLFVGTAQALAPKDPVIVCRRLPTVSGEEECLRIIEGQFVDWLAAAACDRIPTSDATIACMRAIVGRRIPQRLSLLCDAEPSAWGTVRCFGGPSASESGNETSGGWQPPPPRHRPGHDGFGPRPGGCNQWGCWKNGGGCNQWGCWNSPVGSCNQWGCRDVGGCNQWGCWNAPAGGCNQWGCSDHGGCNQWGCWQSPRGSCNQWGCSNLGTCSQWGCPKP